MSIFSEEVLFISLLIVTEFLGLEFFRVVLSTIQMKSAVSCTAGAITADWIVVLSFVMIGSWTSDEVFVVSKTFPGGTGGGF